MDGKTCATCTHWKSTAYSQAIHCDQDRLRECLCMTSPWACETCGRDQPACEEYRARTPEGDAEEVLS